MRHMPVLLTCKTLLSTRTSQTITAPTATPGVDNLFVAYALFTINNLSESFRCLTALN